MATYDIPTHMTPANLSKYHLHAIKIFIQKDARLAGKIAIKDVDDFRIDINATDSTKHFEFSVFFLVVTTNISTQKLELNISYIDTTALCPGDYRRRLHQVQVYDVYEIIFEIMRLLL